MKERTAHGYFVKQVTWLVVTQVRSKSFGLVTECCHYNGRACYQVPSLKWTSHVAMRFHRRVSYLTQICAIRVFTVRASSSPPNLPCFRFFRGLHCWTSPRRKITYSITQSPSLFDAPGTEALQKTTSSYSHINITTEHSQHYEHLLDNHKSYRPL